MKYFAILMGLFLFSNIDAKQKYYKWTDADGNTHYSEKKPFNKKTAEVKVSTHQPTVISHPMKTMAMTPQAITMMKKVLNKKL
ncbi:MAG: DUF4124 domain-containing protein [Alcanivoracaceae bacterium]|nr:DUF4124 domain-containing protein [Alcanivoracaceae bacterium]